MSSIFTITYTVWGISEILINRLLLSKETDKKNLDSNSLRLIWLGVIIGFTLALYISSNYNFSISASQTIKYVGLSLIVIGIILRLIIIKSLGGLFTSDVTIRQNHKLKTNGFYRFLRHPSYTASLLSFTGFGISLNNWISLAILVVTILMVFINRIKIEEKALIEFFGQEYIEYKKSTKALMPFLY